MVFQQDGKPPRQFIHWVFNAGIISSVEQRQHLRPLLQDDLFVVSGLILVLVLGQLCGMAQLFGHFHTKSLKTQTVFSHPSPPDGLFMQEA